MTYYHSPLPDLAIRDMSITQCVFEALENRPDRVVLIDGPTGREMTAADLVAQIRALAGGLVRAGFGPGKVVALMAPNMPEYAVIFHAVALAGATITTINPAYTAPEVRHQLTDSGAVLLIITPDFMAVSSAGAAGTGCTQLMTIEQALAQFNGPPLLAQVPVDLARHPLALPYSCGTTGLPKGVMLSHRNLVANLDQVIAVAGLRGGETSVAFLPFFHIYGMQVLMNVHLVAGVTLVTMPRFDLPTFLGHLQNHKVRMAMAVPPVVNAMAKHPVVGQFDLSALKVFLWAAAPLGAELSAACAARLNGIGMQGYGMTELRPVSHFSSPDHHKTGAAGIALPNTICKLVDPEIGALMDQGQEGELWIKGPQVMLGYLNNPEATARTIDEAGWLHTGDIALFDDEGYLYINDRLRELIKVKGFLVAPAKLEAVLQSHPGVLDTAVIGVDDGEVGEVPIAVVVARPGQDTESIAAFLRERLASYKQPRQIEVIGAIPKSASGKILRRVLKGQYAEGAGS